MEDETERRRETRYPAQAKVIVHRESGDSIEATAANLSSGGMLLHVEPPAELSLGEAVTVDVELPDEPDKPFTAWGLAKIVRSDGCYFGLLLCAGTFESEDQVAPDVLVVLSEAG